MSAVKFLLCVFVPVVLTEIRGEQASFFGNSYIAVPFEKTELRTDISFRFRTRLSDPLIMLIAGTRDYFKIDLEEARLRVVVNLGSGEAEMKSTGPRLDDYAWHDVVVSRRDNIVSMQVNGGRKYTRRIPGQNVKLNVHYGLFLGDYRSKNNTDLFFGHIKTFRGCLSDIKYNDIAVIDVARQRMMNSSVQGITWNCATEFEVGEDHEISFVEDDAYMIIPQKTRYKELLVALELKTTAPDGLLFYNAGIGKYNFFSLQIYNSTLQADIKIDNKTITAVLDNEPLANGNWNKIKFSLTMSTVTLSVNNKSRTIKNAYGAFQLAETSYIGGIENSKRFRASQKGCSKTCETSFKGCIRNIEIFDQKKGLPDVEVSEGLMPGCVWRYPCQQNPCSDESFCVQQGLDSFQCLCKDDLCVKQSYNDTYKVFSRNDALATDLEILSVEPLEVLEGETELITTNNLHLILDYRKYGISDSGVQFQVVRGPKHGTLHIWPLKNSFSMVDVSRDKVRYMHDGSEEKTDSVILAVGFSPSENFILPAYLQGTFRFSLTMNIVPKNDKPSFDTSSEAKVLRVVQGTKKLLTPDIFKAEDADNLPSELFYRIIKSGGGYFENVKRPGTKLSTFTQEDINYKRIVFIQNGAVNDSHITLEVSDGFEVSPVYKIRYVVSPQIWWLEKNTGVHMLHQTWALITNNNLSFASNAQDPQSKILFKIIKKPTYGIIEVEKSVNIWSETDVFSNTDLQQHRVRYKHLHEEPDYDEFQFRTASNKTMLYTFRISFVECTIYKLNSEPVEMVGVYETAVSPRALSFETNPKKPFMSISFQVLQLPSYGYLFFAVSKYHLKCFDNFTQEDVASGNIKFSLHQKSFSDVTDTMMFGVHSPGCNSITTNLTVLYSPSKEDRAKVRANLQSIVVKEGGSTLIEYPTLSIEAEFIADLIYNVTVKPKHGLLQLIKDGHVHNYTDSFTTDQLKRNQLHYAHDDSESDRDSFEFVALSVDDENFEYVGALNIIVQLKNDHSPMRVIDKVFQVVVGGEKLLTGKDLKYVDMDLGTSPSEIVYNCREVTNGLFYYAKRKTGPITQFTQRDLDESLIIFQHKGQENGKVRIWVTDGKFHVNGVLEVQATGPFIYVVMTKKVIVEKKKITVITSEHLYYSTNLNTNDRNVFYEVTTLPAFGKVVSSKNLRPISNFTQEHVNQGLVSYLNDIPQGNADEISLKIRCKDAVNLAQIGVWILSSSYWEPLQIKHLKPIDVEESTSIMINKKNLEIQQENVPSSVITYNIVQQPEYGYLAILSDTKNATESLNVNSFTQDQVNENRVLFIQSGPNRTRDELIFNATNGLITLKNIKMNINIIPEKIYFGSSDLVVNEGSYATLTTSQLYVITEYYKTKITSYKITKKPRLGCIRAFQKCLENNTFTANEMNGGVVQYLHDGSETQNDSASFIAYADGKASEPVTMNIMVMPVNDQAPRLVNNTGLVMWEGGQAVISNEMLAVTDDDRPPETLKYHVQSCWWGNVTLKTSKKSAAQTHFTQNDVDKGLVLFKHLNGSKARFKFNVSDGVHTTKDYLFEIKTIPIKLEMSMKTLELVPLQKKYITPDHLLSKNSDNRKIIYDVITPPALGRLMTQTNRTDFNRVVSSFSQDDINNSMIYYEHLRSFSDLRANDSFVFNVRSHLADPIKNQVFTIDISVSSGELDTYVQIPKLIVDEGGTVCIALNFSEIVSFLEMHSGLHAPILYATVKPPVHGRVFLQNSKDVHQTFSQQQIETGLVFYEHDNSDTLKDSMFFTLSLVPGIFLCNFTVPVTINPVNDQPFKLLTRTPSIKVVEGENHTITTEELCTEDADTQPDKIKYDLISLPKNGRLLLEPDLLPLSSFTQADINNGRVVYVHDGPGLKDSIHLRIWDEKFVPEFTIFNIIIFRLKFEVKVVAPIIIQQGSDVGFINETHFDLETNANLSKVFYSLITSPKHGMLFVDHEESSEFTHLNLISNDVIYLQKDMTKANDSFELRGIIMLWNNSNFHDMQMDIFIKPQVNVGDITARVGKETQITTNMLDAAPLARLTGGNPVITIITSPKDIFTFRKIIRSSGNKTTALNVVVTNFTHEEVQTGIIFIEIPPDLSVPREGIRRVIKFMAAGNIFQPAYGEVNLHVIAATATSTLLTRPVPSENEQRDGDWGDDIGIFHNLYIIIGVTVTVVLVLVIVIITVLVLVKYFNKRAEERATKENIGMHPLPRPPDRLMNSSPSPLKSHLDITFTPPMSLALPQCKVTPLGVREFSTPTPHISYPYGIDELPDLPTLQDPDEWSSLETASETARSIVPHHNQYWV